MLDQLADGLVRLPKVQDVVNPTRFDREIKADQDNASFAVERFTSTNGTTSSSSDKPP